jgi:RNA polymerase subunit RPABC4/transcription elongation factor Spt4
MSLIFTLLHSLIWAIRPFAVPICFVMAWGLVLIVFWSIFAAFRDGMARVKTLHEIPCANCRFFTHSYHLKCPVHPSAALSEAAIGCRDFETLTNRENQSIC